MRKPHDGARVCGLWGVTTPENDLPHAKVSVYSPAGSEAFVFLLFSPESFVRRNTAASDLLTNVK